MAIIVAI